MDKIEVGVEWTEIRKHVILYMLGKKQDGKTDEELTADTIYMLKRILHAVENGTALDQMEKTARSLSTMEDSIRRVQKNERK